MRGYKEVFKKIFYFFAVAHLLFLNQYQSLKYHRRHMTHQKHH